MNKTQAVRRLAKLKATIDEHWYRYYVMDDPVIEDAVYDGLVAELKGIEEEFPDLVTPDSPTQRVGGKVLEGFSSVWHRTRMISLNDVFDEKEVDAWLTRISKLVDTKSLTFFGDVKKDGLACSLVYENGVLERGVTRGDGYVGEDVTANVRTISNLPLRLRSTKKTEVFLRGRTEVRGEIVMYKKDFELLNKGRELAGLPPFANPRNTAAGSIRQLDTGLVAQRKLYFLAYDLLRNDLNEVPTNTFAYQVLKELGFSGGEYAKPLKDMTAMHEYAAYWDEKRHDLPYNIDGLVVKIDDRKIYEQLGVVGKNPRGAIAYKYPAEQSTTKVKDIFVSIGRTGAATPVAMLEPVVIAGSTVQMATLHNEGEVHRKDIRIGDTVVVHKAGDIIPEVVEPITSLRSGNEKKFVMPLVCPECGTKLSKQKAEEAVWRCPNLRCPARSQKHIEHFASKGALDIEGLGEKNVVALMDAGFIHDQADIYSLTAKQIESLERFAEVSSQKLVNAIQEKKNPPLAKFLFGLGIRHVGSQTAIDLANHFKKLETIQYASLEDLAVVEGVGEVVAEAIVAWFADPLNQKLLDKFRDVGVKPQEVTRIGGPLAGQSFVITGTLETMGRDEAAEKIRALGGTFQTSVGKDTDFLVVGKNVGASKLTKAAKLGTKQLTETELQKLLNK